MGSPKINMTNKKYMQLIITDEQHHQIKKIAMNKCITMASVVKSWISDKLEEKSNDG